MRLRSATLILVFCAFGLSACSNGSVNGNSDAKPATTNSSPAASKPVSTPSTTAYPKETVDAFLKSCQGAGSDLPFCTCVLNKIQAKYSFEEFKALESKLAEGVPPEEFLEFTTRSRTDCSK
jgi:hypothetical protein